MQQFCCFLIHLKIYHRIQFFFISDEILYSATRSALTFWAGSSYWKPHFEVHFLLPPPLHVLEALGVPCWWIGTAFYCNGCWSEENSPSFSSSKIKLIFLNCAKCTESATSESSMPENNKPHLTVCEDKSSSGTVPSVCCSKLGMYSSKFSAGTYVILQ